MAEYVPQTVIHNIIAGTYGSGGKIDEYHIFAEKHSLCSKAEQGKQGAVEYLVSGIVNVFVLFIFLIKDKKTIVLRVKDMLSWYICRKT